MNLIKKAKKALDGKLIKYGWYNSLKSNSVFRTLFTTLYGTLINVIFAEVNAVTALRYMSVWYGTFAVYYFILALQRICVILSYRAAVKKSGGDENTLLQGKYRIYLANGAMLFFLDIVLGGVITIMIIRRKPIATSEIMAITSATYTVYKVTMAIRNILKAKSTRDPVIQTVRNIGFVGALASVMSLETTLISTFGETESDSMLTIMTISGFTVCAFTIGLGLYMIIKGIKGLSPDYKEEENGRQI